MSEEGSAEETVEGGKGSKDTKVIDLMTAGNVLGEVCILTHQKSVTGTACETDVQVGGVWVQVDGVQGTHHKKGVTDGCGQ